MTWQTWPSSCPACGCFMEYVAGDFDTGVMAPDGSYERTEGACYRCLGCGRSFDPGEIDRLDQQRQDALDAARETDSNG